MKHLKIQWVPETFAIVSLTVATPTDKLSPPMALGVGCCVPCKKLIVISGESELKADVVSVPQEVA